MMIVFCHFGALSNDREKCKTTKIRLTQLKPDRAKVVCAEISNNFF
jgi:hypothetical protein